VARKRDGAHREQGSARAAANVTLSTRYVSLPSSSSAHLLGPSLAPAPLQLDVVSRQPTSESVEQRRLR
jgi:hypothetical protein